MNLNFIPFPTLTTERLMLRRMNITDQNEIFFLRSNENILEFIDIPKAETVDDAIKFIEKINNNIAENESIMWAITLKENSTLIGTICLWNIDVENNKADIGYMLHPEFQGKGIMQEAVEKVIEYGFATMQLSLVVADFHEKNLRSLKLLEKNGFIYETKSGDYLVYSLQKPNP